MGLEIYNPKYKNSYIESKEKENYKDLIKWAFRKTAGVEEKLGKELFKFKLDDYKKFFEERSVNEQTARMYISVFRNYLEWAMKNVPTAPTSNVLEDISDDYIREISRKPRTKYLHVNEVSEITGLTKNDEYNYPELHNYQDKALVFLLFSGVMGSAMEDLINIKRKDIDFDNFVINISENKKLKMNDASAELIKKALEEKIYTRYITLNENNYGGTENRLANSDYLFRKAIVGNGSVDTDGKMTRPAFQKRLVTLKSWLGIDNFTANTIFQSGLLFNSKNFIDKYGEISIKTLDPVLDAYGVSKSPVRYKKLNFIKDHLVEVYGEEYEKVVQKYNSDR